MSVTAPVVAAPAPRLSRQSLTSLLLLAVAAGAAAVLWLWWQAPTTRAISTDADVFVDLGRATGMVAAYLMLVEVVLVARVPVVERRVGADVTVALHRWIGSYLFGLVLVHVTATTFGYATGSHTSYWSETTSLVGTYPYVLFAAIGLLLLAAVVGLSLRPLRALLPYELWHLTHLLAYVGIGLTIAHEVVDGLQFINNRFLAHLWVALHAAVLIIVLRWRLVEPLRLWLRHDFRVTDVIVGVDGSVTVLVTGRDIDAVRAQPGQFFRWRFIGARTWWQAHPFSLSQAPNGASLRMTAKPVGDHTRALRSLRIGMPVVLEGPYGAVTPALSRHQRSLLIAAGSGIAPLLALAHSAAGSGRAVSLVYRVRDNSELWFADELASLARTGLVDVRIVTGRRHDQPVRTFMHSELPRLLRDAHDADVILCGPEEFVQTIRITARRLGIPDDRIHNESFTW